MLNLAAKQENRLNFHNTISTFQQSIEYDPKIHPNHHALVCVSPFNGYFTTNNMDKLFGWVNNHFESFDVFIMDNASQYTLMALGYQEDEAIKKTKKQDRNLYNKVTSCLMNTGFREDIVQKKIALLSQVSGKDRFQMLYSRYLTEFKNNPSFQKDCLNASEDILSGKMDVVTNDALWIASQYLLLELPIWFNIPEVFNIPSSVLIYKDFSSPWRHLCCNHGFVSPNQKILIKNIEVD